MTQCARVWFSWAMLGVGSYAFNVGSLVYAFLPFLVAALLRGNRDQKVSDMVLHRRPWPMLTAGYYLSVLVIVLLDPRRFSDASNFVLAVLLTFPFLVMAVWTDFDECIWKERSARER